MLKIKTAEARVNFADTINKIVYQGERIVLCRRNKELAAMVSMEDLELLEEIEKSKDLQDAKRILKRIQENKEEVLSFDEALNSLSEG